MKVALWADHAGYELKEKVKGFLQDMEVEIGDLGVNSTEPVDYPLPAARVAQQVREGGFQRAILFCGTGMGVCIVANKVPGIRAVNCTNCYEAMVSRSHNDANVLCLGGRVLGSELAGEIVKIWLTTEFEGGRHARRLAQLDEIEAEYRK
jgi:ribose 5-phosphate isomerase B